MCDGRVRDLAELERRIRQDRDPRIRGSVTTPGAAFVPPHERIATFDNDGTLWCEKPLYVQADFIFPRFQELVRENPDLAKEQPFKAVVEHDAAWLSDIYAHVPELIKGLPRPTRDHR